MTKRKEQPNKIGNHNIEPEEEKRSNEKKINAQFHSQWP